MERWKPEASFDLPHQGVTGEDLQSHQEEKQRTAESNEIVRKHFSPIAEFGMRSAELQNQKNSELSLEFALNHVRLRAVALNPTRFKAVMHPILNYVEFRTNHEPCMVHGVVHGGMPNGSWLIANI